MNKIILILILIIIIVLFILHIFIQLEYFDNKYDITKCDTNKKCITVLTRGYDNILSYSKLIKRNKQIDLYLINKNIDILIFHENNITIEQQTYIKEQTPLLNIKFINILNGAFNKDKELIKFDESTNLFGLGYRHMCSFWFVDFWKFVKEYDYLIRIDEDCFIDFDINIIFNQLNKYIIVAGNYSSDADFVTIGLNEFTLNFINNTPEFNFKKYDKKNPGGPYSNLFGISLCSIRDNNILQKYINEIDKSNYIYKRRWGDLPLWGEIIYYILGEETMLITNEIKYFHESHNSNINC